MTAMEAFGSALNVTEQVAEQEPGLILMSYVPPVGMTHAKYLVKRMRAHMPDCPLAVGYWSQTEEAAQAAGSLRALGLNRTVFTLAAARDLVIEHVKKVSERQGAEIATGTQFAQR
jgi:hypothetical protein